MSRSIRSAVSRTTSQRFIDRRTTSRFNNYRSGTEWDPVKGELQALGDPGVVARLATLGVRYIFVRKVTEVEPKPWQPRPSQQFAGLRTMHRTRDATTYRVVAERAPAIFVTFGSGFDFPERNADRFTRWIVRDVADIGVEGDDCDPCVGRVQLVVSSFGQPRQLEIRDERGELLERALVGIQPETVSFPVHVNGRARFVLRTRPGVQSIAAATGAPDPRIVSIEVGAPMKFVPDRR